MSWFIIECKKQALDISDVSKNNKQQVGSLKSDPQGPSQ